MVRGEQRQLHTTRDGNLVEDHGEVAFHGVFAEGKAFGYLPII